MNGHRVPDYIRFLFRVYLAGLVFFTGFRLILFLTNLDKLVSLPDHWAGLVLKAFLMGFRFDTVISGYLLLLPFLFLGGASFFKKHDPARPGKWAVIYLGIGYSVCFYICTVDIPFFTHFFSRLSTGVFSWIDSPGFMIGLVFQEVRYWIFVVPFFLSVLLFWRVLGRIGKNHLKPNGDNAAAHGAGFYLKRGFFFLLFLVVLFVAIRGRLAVKSPIRVGTAYFSEYAFANQLGLNPVFTLMRSLLDDLKKTGPPLSDMGDREALTRVKGFFNIPGDSPFPSPIAREVGAAGPPVRANVVLVIMESMSAEYLSRYGNPQGLTPTLDRLARVSYTFDHIYTSGTHTYSGIYSTLFAFPVWMREHPLKRASIPVYQGIASELKRRGYRTLYFTTHDDQFDNIGGFLRANGFQQIISEKDYPPGQVLSTLGVPDHVMFDASIPVINRVHGENQPFLAVFLTASNHPPYIIPGDCGFRPRSPGIRQKIVEYSDWSLGRFLEQARSQDWYLNTLFVFVADSGTYVNGCYDLPLCFFHTPLIMYGPGGLTGPRVIKKIGGQIDIFPTIMGILNLSYVNNTFGIDLLRERRPHIYFCGDDKIGCLNQDHYLVLRGKGFLSLYRHDIRDPRDYSGQNKILTGRMKTYCLSMLQAARWMVKHRKTGPPGRGPDK